MQLYYVVYRLGDCPTERRWTFARHSGDYVVLTAAIDGIRQPGLQFSLMGAVCAGWQVTQLGG